ncbi:HAD hydrolase-like protein [Clostridiaceae bacterium 35-E11]
MKDILMIWDVDGTLIDSRSCGRKAMDKAFDLVFGIKDAFKGIKMAGRLDAIIVEDALENKGIINQNEVKLFLDTYCRILDHMLTSGEEYVEILPGIQKILANGKDQHHVCHVLGTGNIERGARIKLKPHDLNRYFPVGGFGDERIERWQMIHQAIENAERHHGVEYTKENIFVIGDTPLDIECGKILGIKSIAVSTGSHSPEELMAYTPDHLFANLEDTENFLKILE